MSYRYIYLFVIVLLCWNCAQLGSPTGGPRDEDPPVVVESTPPNYSTRFEARKILITFDEYVVLDNVNQELVVSPPMEEKPEIKLRKKTIIIQFEETLKENTTYTFNFGSAIKDLHEGNKLLNFEYVFSTGEVLDSLSVKGTLKYAEDLSEPDDPISIMLYTDLKDSVPLIDIPLYISRSDDSGVFSVNNLRADVYKVFALKDGNNNFLFDMPSEEIAFLDTSLIVNAEFARQLLRESGQLISPDVSDTVKLDTTMSDTTVSDTTVLDTTVSDTTGVATDTLVNKGPDLNSIYIDLLLFTEETNIQYLTDYSRKDRRKNQIVFAMPLTDSFRYRPLPVDANENIELLEYFSPDRDSLTLWMTDSTDYKRDTLKMELIYTMKDTADQNVTVKDTLIFSYREKAAKKKKDDQEVILQEKLQVSTIKKGKEQNLHQNLVLDLEFPLESIQDSMISLFHIPDSVEIAEPFQVFTDTTLLTRGWISTEWKSAAQYRMVLLPGAITSIYPMEHDTIDITFKTRDLEYYGRILLNLENVQNRVIVQLISKNNVIQEQEVDVSGQYTFSYLVPGIYSIKFVHDLNGNGKWDTGNYMEKLQPEPVEFLPVEITVRSNWDHDVTMELEK